MDDLVTWLRGVLDEEEAAAHAWLPLGNPTAPQRDHIARHDPARVLREVEAKRRIVDMHAHERFDDPQRVPRTREQDLRPAFSEAPRYVSCGLCDGFVEDEAWWCLTVRLLALPYADRPGYREEWRP